MEPSNCQKPNLIPELIFSISTEALSSLPALPESPYLCDKNQTELELNVDVEKKSVASGSLSEEIKNSEGYQSENDKSEPIGKISQSHIGGKIMVLNASLPTLGPGALKVREDPKILGTAKESTLLQAATGFYKTFAIDCSRSQVSVDMWLFLSVYANVASLSCLPRYTGGNTYFYPAFNAAQSEDALKFAHEFGQVLASPIALEAVMRVRAS
ncbi:hypothetical protein PPACK8108_LOCUS8813 [Phakopsora pachyrhizi]|uniref:Sec23/Sec24 trunk domain-containing protein n=1 Tax=Phakopsora pachyrhizi TaxID=170000 RepID=A0AAV0AZW5_PHAPC|nr:hypothetical protein PPACK8108_LOCUS8813 [Phakopsora pachyrhizi]